MHDLIIPILVGLFFLGKWVMENAGKATEDQPDTRPGDPSVQGPSTPRPIPGDLPSDEERMRRFMEALGLPVESAPPQPVAPPPLQQQPPEVPELPPITPPSAFAQSLRRVTRELQERKAWEADAPTRQEPSTSLVRRARRDERARPSRPPERRHIAPELEPLATIGPLARTQSVSETADQMEVAVIPRMNFDAPVQEAQSAVETAGRVDRGTFDTAKPRPPSISVQPLLSDRAMLRKAFVVREIIGPPKALQSAKTPSIFALP